jgi:hypothetical protein
MPKSSHFSSIPSIINKDNCNQVNSSKSRACLSVQHSTTASTRKRAHRTTHNACVLPSTQQIPNQTQERPITSYIRPTTAATTTKSELSPRRIMAITEGRGVAIEIGICIFDMNSCECSISQVRYPRSRYLQSISYLTRITSWQTDRLSVERYKKLTLTNHKKYLCLRMLQTM